MNNRDRIAAISNQITETAKQIDSTLKSEFSEERLKEVLKLKAKIFTLNKELKTIGKMIFGEVYTLLDTLAAERGRDKKQTTVSI